jgi:hypothetical protein
MVPSALYFFLKIDLMEEKIDHIDNHSIEQLQREIDQQKVKNKEVTSRLDEIVKAVRKEMMLCCKSFSNTYNQPTIQISNNPISQTTLQPSIQPVYLPSNQLPKLTIIQPFNDANFQPTIQAAKQYNLTDTITTTARICK